MPQNTEMPNLFVIGAAKCGTTSLHRYLDLHRQISMSRIKEPDYFLSHLPTDFGPRVSDRNRYLRLFSTGTLFRGESSTRYSMYPLFEGVPAAIAKDAPGARIIYMVRDPVARIASLTRQMISVRSDKRSNSGGPADVGRWMGDFSDPANLYIASGRYMTQLDRYLQHFPREAILVLDSDRLSGEREETMSEVFNFLGVDPDDVEGAFELESNQSEELTVKPAVWRWLKGHPGLRGAWRNLPDATRHRVSGFIGRTLGEPVARTEIDEQLTSELEAIFRPEVERLRSFTGQDFEGWSI